MKWARMGLEVTGTGRGRVWKRWGWAGIGFDICPRAVPQASHHNLPPSPHSAFAFLIYSILLLLDVVAGLFFKRLLYFTLGQSAFHRRTFENYRCLIFYRPDAISDCHPTNSVKALKAFGIYTKLRINYHRWHVTQA